MSADQEWNGSVQTDSWPTSSQSPGISPQPSPDSQLLEAYNVSAPESTVNSTNLIEKKLLPNPQSHTSVSPNYQQSPFISQSHQPLIKEEKRNLSNPDSQPQSTLAQSFNNNCFVASPNIRHPQHTPISSQSSPPKLPVRTFARPPQSSNFSQPIRSVRPLQRPSAAIRPNTVNQRARSPQVNQPIRPRPPVQNPNNPQQRGIQHPYIQQQQPQNAIRQQNAQFVQNQNSPLRPPQPQPHQIRSNPNLSGQPQNQQFPARSMSQTPQNVTNSPRLQSPSAGQRPRMAPPPARPQGPNIGRGIQSQPKPNTFARPPQFPNVNQQGNVRFENSGIRPSGPLGQPVIRHNMPGMEMDQFDEDGFFDDEEDDMYLDDEEEFEDANEGMFNRQQRLQNFPPGLEDHPSDDSEGSDEEQMLLEELVHCENEARHENIRKLLLEKGVTDEEIEEYKVNYIRHDFDEEGNFFDNDIDEDEEDEDDEEEKMISSSSMIMPRNINPVNQQQRQQPPQQQLHQQHQQLPQSQPQQLHQQPQQQQHHHQLQNQQLQQQPQQHHPQQQQQNQQQSHHHHQQQQQSLQNRPSQVSNNPYQALPQEQIGSHPPPQTSYQPASFTSPTMQQTAPRTEVPKPNIPIRPAISSQDISIQRQGQAPLAAPSTQYSVPPRAPQPMLTGQQATTRATTTINPSQIPQQTLAPINQTSFSSHQSHLQGNQQLGAPLPISGNAGYQVATVIPGMRPPVRATGQSPPRYSPVQSHTPSRMSIPQGQFRAVPFSNSPPTDALRARQAVLQMQRSLDAEIMARKRPQLQQSGPFLSQQSTPFGNNQPPRHPRFAGAAPVRHKLPPRTPIPHMPGSRHPTSVTNFNDQHGMAGNSRFHGPSPSPPRPRLPIPQSTQHVVSSSPSSNRFPAPSPSQPQPLPNSNNSAPQQAMVSSSGMRMPSPVSNNQTSGHPQHHQKQMVQQQQIQKQPQIPSISQQPQQLSQQQQQQQQQPPPPPQQQHQHQTPPQQHQHQTPPQQHQHQTPPQQQPPPPPPQQQQQQQHLQMNQQQQPQQTSQHQQQMNQQPPLPPPPQLQHHQQSSQQQAPQTNPKPDSFNLFGVSEDKCILKGRQRLVPNQLYKIRSPIDQTLVLARWNGERFEDLSAPEQKQLKQVGVMSAPPVVTTHTLMPDSNTVTSAVPTNPQSLTTSDQPTPNTSITTAPPSQPPVRAIEGTSENQSTYVKPLPKETTPEVKKPDEEEEEDIDDVIFKRPLNENEDLYRVCKLCGYTSKNFKRCEGCKRVFHGEIKFHAKKKPGTDPNPEPSQSCKSATKNGQVKLVTKPDGSTPGDKSEEDGMRQLEPKSTTKFYGSPGRGRGGRGRRPVRGALGRTRGGGMHGRMGYGPGDDEYDSSDSEDPFHLKDMNDGSTDGPTGKKRPPRGRGKGPSARKRPKKIDEPVTVMISSDEEEPSSTSNNVYGVPPPQSPASSAGSSPIFPSMYSEPSAGYGRFRRVKMEDEEGNSKLRKTIERNSMLPMGMDEDEDDEEEDGDEPPTYQIDIRSVRVGSMRTKPEGPLFINMRGVCFRVKSERTDEPFECEIMSSEVTHVKYYGGQGQPLLFMLLTQECGEKLRDIFHMEEGGDEYLDPSSTDMKQKMVVIIIESLDYLPQDMRETLSLWADINNVPDSDFIEELSEESANDLLIHTAPPILTADVEHHMVQFKKGYMNTERSTMLMPRAPGSPHNAADHEPDSTSSSPPQPTDLRRFFDGPPIRLLQYPPPPARGIAITTEDLFCLNEGEFLNDVIIDFYLQYLHQEMLSKEMQRRTHIFSSFFYKRLTQKNRHSEKTEEDAKKSLPERRHARVKKWTKTVDLFSKDFIIVPINEHSHWYLAVICFPGLATPEVVPFIPSTFHKEEMEDSNSPEGENQEEAGAAEESTSSQPERSGKTVFGRQVDPEKCKKNEESNYSMGQKQPCILMFDSLLGPSRNPNVKMLRDYLQCEWNAKKDETRNISKILRGSTPKVPQQNNYSDCGVYLLQYVESFFEDPIADFQIPMKGLQQWFTEDLIMTKREEIHNLIMRLHRRFQEDRGDPNILDIRYESGPPSPPWDPHHSIFPPPPPLQSKPIPPQEDSADGQESTEAVGQEGENPLSSPVKDGGDGPQPLLKSPTFNSSTTKDASSDKEDSPSMLTDDNDVKPASLNQESTMTEVDEDNDGVEY